MISPALHTRIYLTRVPSSPIRNKACTNGGVKHANVLHRNAGSPTEFNGKGARIPQGKTISGD
jgi:hypothetical protein